MRMWTSNPSLGRRKEGQEEHVFIIPSAICVWGTEKVYFDINTWQHDFFLKDEEADM